MWGSRPRLSAERSSALALLNFPISAPLLILLLWNVTHSIHQQPPQPIAAFEIGINNFESHLVYACPAQQNVRSNFRPYPQGDFQIGLTADSQVILFRAHSAAQAQLADQNP